MSVSMLCRTRRAEHPYTIRSVGLRIWSIEELIYFMRNNLVLLDESILNEELVLWLKDELHLRRLAIGLSSLLSGGHSVRAFILPIFREAGYPGPDAVEQAEAELEALDALPMTARMKKKGDALVGHGKYVQAIESYREILAVSGVGTLGGQFTGQIYHNMGCACARLFQLDEACEHLQRACELLRTERAKKHYLTAVYLKDGHDALVREGASLSEDEAGCRALEREITSVAVPPETSDVRETVAQYTLDCHSQMGM